MRVTTTLTITAWIMATTLCYVVSNLQKRVNVLEHNFDGAIQAMVQQKENE